MQILIRICTCEYYLFQLHQYVHIIKKRGKERGKNVRSVGKVAKERKKVADKNCEKEGKRGGRKKEVFLADAGFYGVVFVEERTGQRVSPRLL